MKERGQTETGMQERARVENGDLEREDWPLRWRKGQTMPEVAYVIQCKEMAARARCHRILICNPGSKLSAGPSKSQHNSD